MGKFTLLTDKLLENSANTDQLNKQIFTDTKSLLEQNKRTLNQTIINLKSTQGNLDLAKKELSKIKTNNLLENILYGAAGLGVGFLVGRSLN